MGTNYGCVNVDHNNCIALPPAPIDEKAWNKIFADFQLKMERSDSLEADVKAVAKAIYQVSNICGTVSSICDIGILPRDGIMQRIRNKCEILLE